MKMLNKSLIATAFMAITIVGCAPSISPDTYTTSTANEVNRVLAGTIVSSRVVQVSGDTLTQGGGAIGTVAGAGAGAIAAASTIGQGNGSLLAGIGGALLGGAVGNYAEKKLTSQQGMEYVVKTTDGGMISVVQGLTPAYPIGQHVLIQYGPKARITADPSYSN